MSRRAVYRTTRVNNVPYGSEVDTTVVHWKFDTSVQSGGIGAGAGAAETDVDSEQKPRQFTVKTWVVNPDYSSVDDGDADAQVTFKVREQRVIETVEPEAGGLSASDIRGAVGGEAIPGIASEQYSEKPEDAQDLANGVKAEEGANELSTSETPALSSVPAVGEVPAATITEVTNTELEPTKAEVSGSGIPESVPEPAVAGTSAAEESGGTVPNVVEEDVEMRTEEASAAAAQSDQRDDTVQSEIEAPGAPAPMESSLDVTPAPVATEQSTETAAAPETEQPAQGLASIDSEPASQATQPESEPAAALASAEPTPADPLAEAVKDADGDSEMRDA